MATVYLGLGSNSEDRNEMLRRARIMINLYIGPTINTSDIYITAPWGFLDQPDFFNQVIEVHTSLQAGACFNAMERIEQHLEKSKNSKYGPRNIDIDLLIYDDVHYVNADIEIPHPRMHERNFVLIPLAEIAPSLVHPVLKKSILQLARECTDESSVVRQTLTQ